MIVRKALLSGIFGLLRDSPDIWLLNFAFVPPSTRVTTLQTTGRHCWRQFPALQCSHCDSSQKQFESSALISHVDSSETDLYLDS